MFWPSQSMGGREAKSGGAGVTLGQGRDGAQACGEVTGVWYGGSSHTDTCRAREWWGVSAAWR